MPGLIGRKIGMTSVFSADGKRMYRALLSNVVLVLLLR